MATRISHPVHGIDRSFENFDCFVSESLRWDLDFQQLDRGGFRGNTLQMVGGAGSFSLSSWNRRLIQRGSPPANCRTFCVPVEPTAELRWQSDHFEAGAVGVIRKGGELMAVTPPGFAVYAFCPSNEVVEDAGRLYEIESPHNVLNRSATVRQHLLGAEHVRKLCDSFQRELRTTTMSEETFRCRMTEITGELLVIFQVPGKSWRPPKIRHRDRVLGRALSVIHDQADDPVSIEDVCAEIGGSIRTLRHAFQESFGVSPKEYLQAYRLNNVWRKWREADRSNTKIHDVANDWGFWHMGQFAKDYRKMFGVLPSGTPPR